LEKRPGGGEGFTGECYESVAGARESAMSVPAG